MPATGSKVPSGKPKTLSVRKRPDDRGATSRNKQPRPDASDAGESAGVSGQARVDDPTQEDRIRGRAYDLYECNGRIDGRALEDWLAAEAEIVAGDMAGAAPLPYAANAS